MGNKIHFVLSLLCGFCAVYVHLDMDLQDLKALGESLGYEGSKLQDFIREQQTLMRDERAAIRQKEKEEREYD